MTSLPPDSPRPGARGRSKVSPEQRLAAVAQVREGGMGITEVARSVGVHPSTLRRWLREDGDPERGAPAQGPQTPETIAQAGDLSSPSSADDREGSGAIDPDRVLQLAHRLRSMHRYVAVVVAWAAMIATAALVPAPGGFRGVLQMGHVLGLAVAVGAVAVIDWHGLLWFGRKRDLRETARVAAAVSPLIWAGLLVLGVTGSFLKPDFTAPLAWLKMAAVLLLALNGVAASETRQVLRRTPHGVAFPDLPRGLAARMVASAAASQLAWLTTIVVGSRDPGRPLLTGPRHAAHSFTVRRGRRSAPATGATR